MHADLACSMACRAARILKHLAMEISSGAHRKFKAHQRAIPYNDSHYFSQFPRDRSDEKWLLLVVLVLVLNEMVLVLERRLRDRSGQCPDC